MARDGSATGRHAWRAGGIVAGAVAAVLAALTLVTVQWARALEADERVLPGTRIAGVDVGGLPLDEARMRVQESLSAALDREITVVHGGTEWRVTARALGAEEPTRAAGDAALAAAATPNFGEVVRAGWASGAAAERPVAVSLPDAAAVDFVAGVAERLDRSPRDARIEWAADGLRVAPDRSGRHVLRHAAAARLRAGVAAGAERVELPVSERAATVTTALAERALPLVHELVEAELDRTLTVRHGDRHWQTTPRALGAEPDLAPLQAAALGHIGWQAWPHAPARTAAAEHGPLEADVPLAVAGETLAGFVAALAAEIDEPARDAQLDWSSGRIEIVAERTGQAVDRAGAAAALRAALEQRAAALDVPVEPVEPDVRVEDYRHVLLVRQDERQLHLYRDGEVARTWPIAIGAPHSPTPSGVFTIGAKRHLPTWYNPAPHGWGADMPRVVGPGPTNPLGIRALNWERDGRDTLIRFHGTANTGSIGRAASRGCVRLLNPHVAELYDLVATGTTIVSLRG